MGLQWFLYGWLSMEVRSTCVGKSECVLVLWSDKVLL